MCKSCEESLRKLKHLRGLALRPHFYVDEDTWYSCPKAPEGCANPQVGLDCNCGADAHNAEVERVFEELSRPYRDNN